MRSVVEGILLSQEVPSTALRAVPLPCKCRGGKVAESRPVWTPAFAGVTLGGQASPPSSAVPASSV
jgi:hypothetical protein